MNCSRKIAKSRFILHAYIFNWNESHTFIPVTSLSFSKPVITLTINRQSIHGKRSKIEENQGTIFILNPSLLTLDPTVCLKRLSFNFVQSYTSASNIAVIKIPTMIKIRILTIIALFSPAYTWPTGAPEEACETLTPQHGANRSKAASQSPFTVSQSQNTFEPGDRIKGEY